MNRAAIVLAALFMAWTSAVSAHEVPDRVDISVLLKPEAGRMLILARVPANALIDFLLPTQEGGNWIDLANADTLAAEGARVWIADRLSLRENGTPLSTPHLLKLRLSRVNDPAFASFDTALARVTGPPLPLDILVLQDQITVDALLEVPIGSPSASFTFIPRFARLGLLVYTTLSYLPPDGAIQHFYYEGDPESFALNPTRADGVRRFFAAGVWHYLGDLDYLLFALCAAMVFLRPAPLASFTLILAGAELIALLAARAWLPALPWVPVLCGVLVAAATVCAGIEAIVTGDGKRRGLAIAAGAAFGAAFWSFLQPVVQFGGSHPFAAALAFAAGVLLAEAAALAGALLIVRILLRLSRVSRGVVIVAAAISIHVSWRRMLDRVDALTLVGLPIEAKQLLIAAACGAGLIVLLAWMWRELPRTWRETIPGRRRTALRESSPQAE